MMLETMIGKESQFLNKEMKNSKGNVKIIRTKVR